MPRIARTADEAVASIADGEQLWCHSMAATPVRLLEALARHCRTRRDVTLMQLHTEGSGCLDDEALSGRLTNRCFFAGAPMRAALAAGRADYVPIFLSEVPKLFRRREERVDAALVQVSPPDRHGLCSLGISVEATRAALETAGRVIAHVNPRMPRVLGDGIIPYERLHTAWESPDELPEHPPAPFDETTQTIGRHVAELIGDGDCLQLGIGAIPDAALACLGDRRDLGVHSEMFSDGILPLVKSGVITGRHKRKHPGKIVAGFVMGTRALYDFVDDNPGVLLLDIEYVNDTSVIRQNRNMVAINSAIQVDLSGQVCADSIGTRIYSGVGGQMDFMRGAAISEGGRAIIALPSTAAGGAVSRITSLLAPGAGVVTTRAHVHYVVTEHGIANLRGRSLRERARALIAIADPRFREPLARACRDDWKLAI